jgi:hypothetical protein
MYTREYIEQRKREIEERTQQQIEQAPAAAKAAEPQRRPLAELGFMVQPALLIAMFTAVWIASDFLYAVAALVAVSLPYRPVAVCVFGALGWWYDRRTRRGGRA